MNDEINLIDSGSGAYNVLSYLVESDKRFKNRCNINLLPYQIGNKPINEIKKMYMDKVLNESLNESNTFMCCNTLNSLYPTYSGAFNELLIYLKRNKGDKNLIICTKNTQTQLDRYYKKNLNFETITINQNIIEKIDKGIISDVELNSNLYDKLILGCTHFDLLNINTNMDVISTSMLCANRLKSKIDL